MLEKINEKQIVICDLSKEVIKNTIDQIRNMNADQLYETFKTYFVLQKVIFSKIPTKFVFNNDFKESEHPRDNAGKFTDTGSIPDHIRRKIESVKIDFARDNILPELNTEDLEALNITKKLPIRLKKSIIDRNKIKHPDIKDDEIKDLISNALYNPDFIAEGNKENYYHFISKDIGGKSPLTLIDITQNDSDCIDIVHYYFVRAQSKRKEKLKRIK